MRPARLLTLALTLLLAGTLAACGSIGGSSGSAVDARIQRMAVDPPQYSATVRMDSAVGYELALDHAVHEDSILTLYLSLKSPPPGTPAVTSTVRHQVDHSTGPEVISALHVYLRRIGADGNAEGVDYGLVATEE